MQSQENNLPLEIEFNNLPELQDAVVIDCRTEEEFELSCLQHAVNIPLQHLSIRTDDLPFTKDDRIFVYCKSGNRSETFATYLRSLGFAKCQTIAGGFETWGEEE